MKKLLTITLTMVVFGLFAEEVAPLEKKETATKWKVSARYKVAPKVKTSARLNGSGILSSVSPAVLESTPKASSSTITTIKYLGTTVSGTSVEDAMALSGYTGGTVYEFENGYINLDDGVGLPGETHNWHFDDASAFDSTSQFILGKHSYSQSTVSYGEKETVSVTETGGSSSLDTATAELTDSSSEAAQGFELRIGRTIYEKGRFGIDIDLGYTYFDDIDAFSIGGVLAPASAPLIRTTKTTTIRTTEEFHKSGVVYTAIRQPEFTDIADIQNNDGTIGGAYNINGSLTPGYQIPVLTVTEDRFSILTTEGPTQGSFGESFPEETISSEVVSKGGSSVDVKSEGTLSLQELRFGIQPYWKAAKWLKVSLDAGIVATYSELDVTTAINVGGSRYATFDESENDWTIAGFLGLGVALSITEHIDFVAGYEARIPTRDVDFDCGYVSGSVDMPKWSGSVGIAIRW